MWFTEETPRSHPPTTRVERSLESVEGYVRDFAEDNPHVHGDAAALLQRARPRHRHPHHPGPRAAGRAVDLRLRPALPVRARGRRHPVDPVRARPPPARHLQRGRRRPAAVDRGRPASAASAPSRCRRSAPAWPRCRSTASASPLPRRAARPAALRPRHRQPPAQGGRVPLPVHVGRRGQGLHRGDAAAPDRRLDRADATATSATSSSSSATRRPSSARSEADHDRPWSRPRSTDGVAIVTLDDPDRRNALNPEMVGRHRSTPSTRLEADDDGAAPWSSPARRRRSAPAPTWPPRHRPRREGLRDDLRGLPAHRPVVRCPPSPRSTAPRSAPA